MAVETKTLKALYFQLVDNQALSTRGQADVNLHRLASSRATAAVSALALDASSGTTSLPNIAPRCRGAISHKQQGSKMKDVTVVCVYLSLDKTVVYSVFLTVCIILFRNQTLMKPGGGAFKLGSSLHRLLTLHGQRPHCSRCRGAG